MEYTKSLSNETDEGPAIVLDCGSGICKSGFAGDDAPLSVISSCIGRICRKGIEDLAAKESEATKSEFFIGKQIHSAKDPLTLNYPIEQGVVADWDEMEKIWSHIFFTELQADPLNRPVLITEPPLNPKRNRERMTEIMFETYRTPAFYVAIGGVLALYASGLTTGLVLDLGDGVCHSIPIDEGYALPHGIFRLNLAGRDLTDYLMTLMREKDLSFSSSMDLQIIQKMKEKVCYVAVEYADELVKGSDILETFQLPDGQQITVSKERFQCSEALFQPSLVGLHTFPGIHQIASDSVMKCKPSLRPVVSEHVILCGGSSFLPGMEDRLTREMRQLLPFPVTLRAPSERKYSIWIGGSILGSLSTFQSMWIHQLQYEENGPSIVHRRCF